MAYDAANCDEELEVSEAYENLICANIYDRIVRNKQQKAEEAEIALHNPNFEKSTFIRHDHSHINSPITLHQLYQPVLRKNLKSRVRTVSGPDLNVGSKLRNLEHVTTSNHPRYSINNENLSLAPIRNSVGAGQASPYHYETHRKPDPESLPINPDYIRRPEGKSLKSKREKETHLMSLKSFLS